MKNISIIFLGLLLLFFLSINALNAQNNNIKSLNCEEFYNYLINSQNIKLFDIRDELKFSESRIENAQFADTKERIIVFLNNIDKTDSIFIYCEIGKRSQQCTSWLQKQGYKNIFQLKNGFEQWKKENYPIDHSVLEVIEDEDK